MEKWPIIPNRIALEEDISIINNKGTEVGIISRYQLKGILDEIASKVKSNIICIEVDSHLNSIITIANYYSEDDSSRDNPKVLIVLIQVKSKIMFLTFI